jgi:hypothetical protein
LAGLVVLGSLARFALEAHQTAAGHFGDFRVFWQQFQDYIQGDPLYPHALERYKGGSPVYKFPPFYATVALPFARLSLAHQVPVRDVLHYHLLIQILIHGITLGVLCLATFRWILFSKPSDEGGGLPRGAAWVGVAIVLAFGLNYEPFFETLHGLQVETVLLALITASFWFRLRRQDALAGIFLGVAAMLKVYPGFLVLGFLLERRLRAVAWFAATCVVILILSTLVVGPEDTGRYFFRILPYMMQALPAVTQGNESENICLAKYIHWAGLSLAAATGLAKAAFVGMLGWTSWVAHRHARRDPSPVGAGLRYVAFLPLMLLGLNDSWLNYQLVLLLPLAWVAGRGLVSDDSGRIAAYLMLLAYLPTMTNANTNAILSKLFLPDRLYQLAMDARVLTTLLVWGALMWLLTRRTPLGTVHGDSLRSSTPGHPG